MVGLVVLFVAVNNFCANPFNYLRTESHMAMSIDFILAMALVVLDSRPFVPFSLVLE